MPGCTVSVKLGRARPNTLKRNSARLTGARRSLRGDLERADAERRRNAVAALWTEDALHILQSPQTVQEAAAALDVTPTFQARGHRELEARVARAYEEFVAPGEFSFRSQDNAARLGDVVKFGCEMVSSSGEVAGVGLEFVILDPDSRIRTDYQFIESGAHGGAARAPTKLSESPKAGVSAIAGRVSVVL